MQKTTRFTQAVNDAAVGYSPYGSPAWQNPPYAITPSDDAAVLQGLDCEVDSNWLKLTNIADKLPPGAIPDGVEVCVKAKGEDSGFGGFSFLRVQLCVDGTVTSEDRASQDWVSNGPAVVKTFGGPADRFGLPLDRDTINDSGFGVGLSVVGSSGCGVASIFDVEVTIYYH